MEENALLWAVASADERPQLPERVLYFRPSSGLSPELGVISAEARVGILERGAHEPRLGGDQTNHAIRSHLPLTQNTQQPDQAARGMEIRMLHPPGRVIITC